MKALLAALACGQARAQTNLIPNPNFSDPGNPLLGWRTAFPYEPWYVDNVKFLKPTAEQGKKCAVVELPPGVAGNQGGKIESAFVKAEPGATYRVTVDCLTWDFAAKLHADHHEIDHLLTLIKSADGVATGRQFLKAALTASRKHFQWEEKLFFPLIDKTLKRETSPA